MWCCTKRQCNIHYTEQEMQDFGYSPGFKLEYLTCHELQPQFPESTSTGSRRSGAVVPVMAVLASGFVVSTALALLMFWRSRRANSDDNIKRVQHQREMLTSQEEMHRNCQAVFAKVQRPLQMLQMDLLATSDSCRTVSAEGAISNGAVLRNQVTVCIPQKA
jgi:hypothetical protein